MTARGRGRAPAKAILLGEHFVVHGVPALAVPVSTLEVFVDLSRAGEPRGEADADVHAHARACLVACHEHLGGPDPGQVHMELSGQIPISAGLGSSAALAVATARAWCDLIGAEADAGRIRPVADACERLVHGTPSGIDVATVLGQRPLRFVKGAGPTPLSVGRGLAFLVLDSQTPGRTKETVAHVAAERARDPASYERRAERAAELVAEGEAALAAGDAAGLGAAMNAVHQLLRELGVSTPALDRLVDAARAAGAAGAKLTGGGGGGCVLVACRADEREGVVARLAEQGVTPLVGFELDPGSKE